MKRKASAQPASEDQPRVKKSHADESLSLSSSFGEDPVKRGRIDCITEMPPEILHFVLSFLRLRDVVMLLSVDKFFRALINNPWMWKQLYLREFQPRAKLIEGVKEGDWAQLFKHKFLEIHSNYYCYGGNPLQSFCYPQEAVPSLKIGRPTPVLSPPVEWTEDERPCLTMMYGDLLLMVGMYFESQGERQATLNAYHSGSLQWQHKVPVQSAQWAGLCTLNSGRVYWLVPTPAALTLFVFDSCDGILLGVHNEPIVMPHLWLENLSNLPVVPQSNRVLFVDGTGGLVAVDCSGLSRNSERSSSPKEIFKIPGPKLVQSRKYLIRSARVCGDKVVWFVACSACVANWKTGSLIKFVDLWPATIAARFPQAQLAPSIALDEQERLLTLFQVDATDVWITWDLSGDSQNSEKNSQPISCICVGQASQEKVRRSRFMVQDGLLYCGYNQLSGPYKLPTIVAYSVVTGEVQWQKNLGKRYKYGGMTFTRLPMVVVGNILLAGIHSINQRNGEVVAMDRHSGKTLWVENFEFPNLQPFADFQTVVFIPNDDMVMPLLQRIRIRFLAQEDREIHFTRIMSEKVRQCCRVVWCGMVRCCVAVRAHFQLF